LDTHLAFSLPRGAIRSAILIPKYYDPDLELAKSKAQASGRYLLPKLGEILLPGIQGSQLGDWIDREYYGTGNIPYVRTSDLSHWLIRPDFKKGVSEEVYEQYRSKQNVQPGDILMVAHGTYLVGNVAIVTGADSKLLLQDHVFRLTIDPASGIDSYYLLCALSTKFVRRQIRARQFSADIIDKVGLRHLEVSVPVLKDRALQAKLADEVSSIIHDQMSAREQFRVVTGSTLRMTRERAEGRFGFQVPRAQVRRRILIPKYYDPSIAAELEEAKHMDGSEWQSLSQLRSLGLLAISDGVEVGKMAYGTGDVPFIRTSDIAEQQVKLGVRHGVSSAIYDRYAGKAAVKPGDILLVTDGTYLVGSTALVTEQDVPALFCGGIARLRSLDQERLSPYWLLAVLNLPIVRKQMRARQFTRDVIDTLGDRLLEVEVPSPGSAAAGAMSKPVELIVRQQHKAKMRIQQVADELEPEAPAILAGRPSWSMR
jgi:hypothetical protein